MALEFTPMNRFERVAFENQCAAYATDGRFELYKTTAKFEGPPGREQHGFRPKKKCQVERNEDGASRRSSAPQWKAQREVVHLTFYRGVTQRQIAAHTGIPLGTIKTRLELAQRKLRSAVPPLANCAEI